MTEMESEVSRTEQVLARLTAADVHQAAKALPSKSQQQLARSLGVPMSVLLASRNAADVVRRRARRLGDLKASALARDLAEVCVSETIDALGDRHDRPSYEDLEAVLDPICARWGARLAALMLAATADGDFNAAKVCARMLDEDPRFALDTLGPVEQDTPPVPVAGPTATLSNAELDAKEEQRRQRRESKKAKKAKQPAKRADAPSYRRKHGSASGSAPTSAPDSARESVPDRELAPVVVPRMRPSTVVGSYVGLERDDALIGAIVPAFIPYGEPTPDGEEGKMRPCVVIAACEPDSLVVRPCYSEGGARADDWRTVRVTDTRAAGLDKNSYVDIHEFVIQRGDAEPILGRLARDDWNAL